MGEQSTDYALLGLLSIEPMSGYDIRQNFQESLNFFWNESYGQIYPALKRLLAQGCVAPVAGRQNGRRQRRAYAITSKGRAQLRTWLAKPPRKQPIRDELLLKLFLGRLAAPGVCAEHIRRLRREQEELLAHYQEIKKRVGIERAGHPHARFWYMTLKHGIEIRRARIRWCDETLAALEESPRPSRRPQKKNRNLAAK